MSICKFHINYWALKYETKTNVSLETSTVPVYGNYQTYHQKHNIWLFLHSMENLK